MLHLLPAGTSLIFGPKTIGLALCTLLIFLLFIRQTEKQGLNSAIVQNIRDKWQTVQYANAILLVKDGVLQLDKLYQAQVTSHDVYTAMRTNQITQLTDVKRLFLTPEGVFNIYKKDSNGLRMPVYKYYEGQDYEKTKEAETC